ncbi:MAG: HAMP domain-containing protein [Candidatus Acididesulfobacter guangdongensis]|uniref:histidine kinase n=1 Tax=Acididesulfobacter guangdongensis TaxID=2597225 RepID=A0A519BEP0_ACIG2|nr:MAG: HAMP domain-containing protein [Candidatus Acididesulfobacter guangdongensis]
MFTKLILLFKNIFEKLYSVSLRNKIISLIILITLLIGLFTVTYTYYVFNKESNLQLKVLSKTLAEDLSYQSVHYIKKNNIINLMKVIRNMRYRNKDIRYIFIENNKGKVIASTFENGFPLKLLKIHNDRFKKISVVELKNMYGGVWDTSYPILKGKLGVVRVGILTKYSRIIANSFIGSLAVVIILIIFINIIIFSTLITFITKPIVKLTNGLKNVGGGDLTVELEEVKNNYELSEAIHAFNKMIKRLRDAETIKLEKSKLMKEFTKKIMDAHEEERKRISRQLHDQIGQILANIKIRLKILENSDGINNKIKNDIKILRDNLSNDIELVHSMAKNLRPAIIDELGLFNAINYYIDDFVKISGIKVKSDFIGQSSCCRLQPEIEIAIYRIVQEALLNVVSHSKATFVRIILECNKNEFRGVIEDNGIGFNYKKGNVENLGLYGMIERAELLNGRLDIKSEKGNGTTITFNVNY